MKILKVKIRVLAWLPGINMGKSLLKHKCTHKQKKKREEEKRYF